MAVTEKDIQDEFLRRTLSRWGGDLVQQLQESIDRHGLVKSGRLRRSLHIDVFIGGVLGKQADAVLQLWFNEYGRLVDMGVKRNRLQGNFLSAPSAVNRGEELMGEYLGRRKRKRKYRGQGWYVKTVFRNISDLKYQLANNYDEITRRTLKAQLLKYESYLND